MALMAVPEDIGYVYSKIPSSICLSFLEQLLLTSLHLRTDTSRSRIEKGNRF